MSHFLDRLTFFTQQRDEFADGHGVVTHEDRTWEDGYRKRWQHDKIVGSTHGTNCTGSCSRIGAHLYAAATERAVTQYVRLLAGRASVEGVDLDGADTPLVQ